MADSSLSSDAPEACIREDWDELANDCEAEQESAIRNNFVPWLQNCGSSRNYSSALRRMSNVETITTSCLR